MPSVKPTVGRIVHFHNTAFASSDHNSVGEGPYAAMVTQVFDGPYVNLKVMPPFGDAWHEGSVSEKSDGTSTRYWVWPPREPPATMPALIGEA